MASSHFGRRLLVLCTLLALVVIGFPRSAPSVQAQGATPRTVMVHLFEWKWTDIANECEQFLGPKGFAGIQVSPPNEHIQGPTWWTRYQPVSYRIESRGGTRAQFANMVSRCKAVGVDVYVDAVINHMTGSDTGGTGWAGSSYTHFGYPGIYGSQDFHHCGRNGTDDIVNYGDRWEVQNCELVNLADLDTASSYVRGKIAAYLNDLRSLGVAGFRFDAAKHMPTGDIGAIVAQVPNSPYIYQEVIDQGGEPIVASEYFPNGDVTEFKYSVKISEAFYSGQLQWLSNWGTPWGFMPADKAVVFVNNHDNQRGHGGGGHIINYKDGKLHDLANIFMLAHPYGYPQIMSSYAFSNGDQGPPSSPVYSGTTANCSASTWICEHRTRAIANMVGFHNATTDNTAITNWWTNGLNQIAFGRGDKGFVVINRESTAINRTFQTSMAAGTYCDVIVGEKSGTTCTGRTLTVNSSGQATITVPAMEAAAIHINAKLGTVVPTATPGVNPTPTRTPTPGTGVNVSFEVNATTVVGQDIYVVGNIAALGSWNTSNAILLSSATYPIWKKTISLPGNTAIEYKYIRKQGTSVTWESGSNRTFTTPASGSLTRSDTWRP